MAGTGEVGGGRLWMGMRGGWCWYPSMYLSHIDAILAPCTHRRNLANYPKTPASTCPDPTHPLFLQNLPIYYP
jgi:hypothetical protein